MILSMCPARDNWRFPQWRAWIVARREELGRRRDCRGRPVVPPRDGSMPRPIPPHDFSRREPTMTKILSAADLGRVVRQRRKEAGFTLKDAAGMAGVGVRFLSELERGKQTL